MRLKGVFVMRLIRVISVALLLALVMCLTACGSSDKKKFVGTWVTDSKFDEQVTVTFNEDGTFKWVRNLTLGAVETTGKFELDEKEKYLTMYPNRNPDDTIGTSENEWGFRYVLDSEYLTFYKMYSEEPVYALRRQK